VDFCLDDGKLVVEVVEAVILALVALDFSSSIPIIEVGDSVTERVVGGSGTVE
jgi:hypothetical protein